MGSLSIHELTAAYALDALDAEEAREYERHLAACDECQVQLADLSQAASALAYAAEAPAPPEALRDRILERSRSERTNVVPLRPGWTRAAKVATALAAAAALVLAVSTATLFRSLDSERSARDRSDRALAVLSDPTARRVTLDGANGQLVVAGREGVLVVRNLDDPAAGKTYEAWVIPSGGAPRPAGTFDPDEDTTVHGLDEPVPPGATVAVTMERRGGVNAPTGRILLSAKVA